MNTFNIGAWNIGTFEIETFGVSAAVPPSDSHGAACVHARDSAIWDVGCSARAKTGLGCSDEVSHEVGCSNVRC